MSSFLTTVEHKLLKPFLLILAPVRFVAIKFVLFLGVVAVCFKCDKLAAKCNARSEKTNEKRKARKMKKKQTKMRQRSSKSFKCNDKGFVKVPTGFQSGTPMTVAVFNSKNVMFSARINVPAFLLPNRTFAVAEASHCNRPIVIPLRLYNGEVARTITWKEVLINWKVVNSDGMNVRSTHEPTSQLIRTLSNGDTFVTRGGHTIMAGHTRYVNIIFYLYRMSFWCFSHFIYIFFVSSC